MDETASVSMWNVQGNVTLKEDIIFLRLNEEKILSAIPVLVFISMIILIGTVGNLLVLGTYFKQIPKNSTNLFIFCLAVLDLISCVISLPAEMLVLLQPLTFNYPWLCKFLRFFSFSANLASGYIIVCIAFDRYLRIAHPYRRFRKRTYRGAVISLVGMSLLVSSMALFVYGRENVVIYNHPELEGRKCGTDPIAKETYFPLLFSITILASFVIGVCIVLIIYIKLCIFVRRWNKERALDMRNRRNAQNAGCPNKSQPNCYNKPQKCQTDHFQNEISLLTNNTNLPEGKHNTDVGAELETMGPRSLKITDNVGDQNASDDPDDELTKSSPSKSYRSYDEAYETDDSSEGPLSVIRSGTVGELRGSLENSKFVMPGPIAHIDSTVTLPLRRMSTKQGKQKMNDVTSRKLSVIRNIKKLVTLPKYTAMFIIATVAFVACQVPYVCIKVTSVINPVLSSSLSMTQTMFYMLAELSYTISYAINPIIYSFLNPRFRNKCGKLLATLLKKIRCRL